MGAPYIYDVSHLRVKETRKINTESIRNGFVRHISNSPILFVPFLGLWL